MARILITQDLDSVTEPLRVFLQDHMIVSVAPLAKAFSYLHEHQPEIVILTAEKTASLQTLVTKIRQTPELRQLGIIIVAIDQDPFTEKNLYEAGTDIVLGAPLDFQKTLHLIQALASRINGFRTLVKDKIMAGGFELELNRQRLHGEGQQWNLSPVQVRLLVEFFEHPDQIVSREYLRSRVWAPQKISNRSIDAQISKLRKLVPALSDRLESIYGKGYLFSSTKGKTKSA